MLEQAFWWAIQLLLWCWLMVLKGCALVLTWVVPPLHAWLTDVDARMEKYRRGLVTKRRDSVAARDDQGPRECSVCHLVLTLMYLGVCLAAISMACLFIVIRLLNI